ncbi:MAG: hypothetical protein KBB52_00045 [Candidatus Omnitrophica bacterium]|nr:hypothetical protein [Candidatus Omnitrophota bacterium]
MLKVKPIYIKLLIGAIAVFIAGVGIMLSDLYNKVGDLEFEMLHLTGACPIKHHK